MPVMPLWMVVTLLVGVALLVFVLPLAWGAGFAALRGDDALEGLTDSLEAIVDGFGGRIARFVGLSLLGVIAWYAWQYFRG